MQRSGRITTSAPLALPYRPMTSRHQFRPPRLWTREELSRDRHATWLELFYDLVFVVAIAQMTHLLEHDLSPTGVGRYVLLYIPCWWAWLGHTFYLTRFDSDDLGHQLLTFAQMLAAAMVAIHIPGGLEEESSRGFALAYAVVRALLIFEYWRAGKALPIVRPFTDYYLRGFSVAALLWVASAFVGVEYRFALWILALIIDIGTPLSAGELQMRFPPHLHHIPERLGLFTLIVLGESIVGSIVPLKPADLGGTETVAALSGFVLACALWWVYFVGVRAAAARQFDMAHFLEKYVQWIFSHLPLTMALTATAAGVRSVMHHPDAVIPHGGGIVLCLAVGISMLSVVSIYASKVELTPDLRRLATPHVVIAVAAILLSTIANQVSGVMLLGLLALLGLAQVALGLRENDDDDLRDVLEATIAIEVQEVEIIEGNQTSR